MLNILTADETDPKVQKITDKRPEETRRMQVWLDEKIASGKKRVFGELVALTPVLAQLLYDRNPINRPISKRIAVDMASDIAGGRFVLNGEPIIVSATGLLLDGQHRCLQVVTTGKMIETIMVFGPKDSARYTIDTGKSKTVSNYLSMKGRAYANVLATVASYHLQWGTRGFVVRGALASNPTKQEILAAADELPGLDRSLEFTAPAMKILRCHSALAFCHYVFAKKSSREHADEFMTKLIEGDGLRRGEPIHFCRNRLLTMSGRGTEANARLEVIFRAWNAWRLGYKLERCPLRGGELPKIER